MIQRRHLNLFHCIVNFRYSASQHCVQHHWLQRSCSDCLMIVETIITSNMFQTVLENAELSNWLGLVWVGLWWVGRGQRVSGFGWAWFATHFGPSSTLHPYSTHSVSMLKPTGCNMTGCRIRRRGRTLALKGNAREGWICIVVTGAL